MTDPRTTAAALLAVALVSVPGAAVAQNVYADQVQGYLDEVQDRALSQGFTLEGESTGWMMNGAEGATIVRLPAGSYVAIGACDDDCADIDLMVSRIDTQESLDADREMDAVPVVEFSIPEETDVLISISMPDCETARCYAGYRWFSADAEEGSAGEAGAAGAAGAGSWEDQVMALLEQLPSPEGMSVVDQRTGLVGAGEETRFSLNLGPGSYGGVAVCDYDCSNVDLAVYDAGGSLVTSDVLDDDVPIVEIEIAKGGGTYHFDVRMITCSTSSCGYGFRLYRRD